MEVVAALASVSQLVAYSLSSTRFIHHQYKERRRHGSTFRNRELNLSLLLGVIKDLSKQGVSDDSPVLPILIDIETLASQILDLLQPTKFWGFDWAPFTKQKALRSAFQTLDKKQRLLLLHVSRANSQALTALQQTLLVHTAQCLGSRTHTQAMTNPPKKADPPQKFSIKNMTVAGYNEMLGGHALPPEVEIHDVEVLSRGVNFVANMNGGANISEISGILREQPKHGPTPSWKAQTSEDQQTVATGVLAGQPGSMRAGIPTQHTDTSTGAGPSTNTIGDQTYATIIQQYTWSSSKGGVPFMTAPQIPVLVEERRPNHRATPQRAHQVTQGHASNHATEFENNEPDNDA